MRKSVIILTSPNKMEYESIWRCHKGAVETTNKEMLTISSTNCQIYVLNGLNRKYYDNGWDMYNIVSDIKRICYHNIESKLTILIHESDSFLVGELKSRIDFIKHSSEISCLSYTSMRGEFYDNYVKPFKKEASDKSIENLQNGIELKQNKERSIEAQRLRHDILSPFIALEILNSFEEKSGGKIEKKLKGAIDIIDQEGLISDFCEENGCLGEFECDIIKNLFTNYNFNNLCKAADMMERQVWKH